MQTRVWRSGLGGAVVGIEGTFGVEDADELRAMTTALQDAGSVTLDFHEVREASDLALAKLVRELFELPVQVSMVGLSVHQHRLLRYVGLGPSTGPRS